MSLRWRDEDKATLCSSVLSLICVLSLCLTSGINNLRFGVRAFAGPGGSVASCSASDSSRCCSTPFRSVQLWGQLSAASCLFVMCPT